MEKRRTMEHTQLLVLSLLAQEDRYGYQMIVELERRSDHTFSMKEGTLYPMLHSLEKSGAVSSYWLESEDGRKRKYYKLEKKGAMLLEEKKQEWQLYTGSVNKVIGGMCCE